MTLTPLPASIIAEVVRQQEAMGWPDMVPAYVEIPQADGSMVWDHYHNITVGIAEQLVEHHTRLGRAAICKWLVSPTRYMLRKAGRNILYARLYRCRYLQLIGKTDSTEADMPFPCLSENEVRKMEAGQE